MEAVDASEVVKSQKYYAHLLKDLEIITRPKIESPFVLPETSIWHKLKLGSTYAKDFQTVKGSKFSLEKEILRIQVATDVEMKKISTRPSRNPKHMGIVAKESVGAKDRRVTVILLHALPQHSNTVYFLELWRIGCSSIATILRNMLNCWSA
jgi:hypothetical protein